MSIGQDLDTQVMLKKCMPVFLKRLGCSTASVLKVENSNLVPIVALPRNNNNDEFLAALQIHLDSAVNLFEPFCQSNGRVYYAWNLSGFGALVLGRSQELPAYLVREIQPIANKLSVALQACAQFQQLADARYELTSIEQRWHLALEGSRVGVWDLDIESGQIFYSAIWNSIALSEGIQPGSSISDWLDIMNPDDVLEFKRTMQNHLQGNAESFSSEHRLRTAQGTWVWVQCEGQIFSRCEQLEAERMIGTLSIISERKQMESELLEARDEAERVSKMKTEFLANISHEIRTPMNGIISMTELTLESSLDSTQEDNLEIVQVSARHLLSIINDVLDYSKIESGKLETSIDAVDTKKLVNQSVRMMKHQAEEKGLALSTEFSPLLPSLIETDSQKVRQILVNLIGNAIKFTPEGGIEITVDLDESEDQLRVNVTDTGIGIPEDRLDQIFHSFHQADGSITREYGGTGLGLSISRNLAELLGGGLTVESQVGKGSSFTFTFGYLPHDENTSGVLSTEPLDIVDQDLRILVAEDNAVNQKIIRKLLEGSGYKIEIAGTGIAAIEVWRERAFDLIVMDMMMPEMDGLEATRLIREEERSSGSRTPIIALTANAMTVDRDRCFAAGMDGHITKPITRESLHREIVRVLASA